MSKKSKKTEKSKKKVKSEALLAQRQRSNIVRREKYETDSEYRELAKLRSRESYRRNNGFIEPKSLSTAAVSKFAKPRVIRISGKKVIPRMLTLTNTEAANCLGLTLSALYKWQGSGRMPEPIFKLEFPEGVPTPGLQCLFAYAVPEIKAVIEIISEHRKKYSHYRSTHTETIRRITETLEKIRKEIKNG